MTKEPTITMNGKELTNAQAMTVRVALESFSMSLHAEGLGDDEHGKTMTELYQKRIQEIREIMYVD